MAAPGESFPQQFAQAILQLRQAKVQKDADLSEMRNDRAARNFLDQQKIALQEQQQANELQKHGDINAFNMAKLQADSADRQFAIEARVQFETENLKLQRDGMTSKAISDLNTEGKGTAFLPYTSVGDAQKFRDSWNTQNAAASGTSGSYQLFEHEIPGQGIVFQRVGGPDNEEKALKLRKLNAEIETENQNSVLKIRQGELAKIRGENLMKVTAALDGKVSEKDANLAQKYIESKQDIARSQLAALSIKNDPQSKRLFAEITLDWKAYYSNDPETLENLKVAGATMGAALRSAQRGQAPPPETSPEAVEQSGEAARFTTVMVEGRAAALKAEAKVAADNTVVGKVYGPGGNFAVTAGGARTELPSDQAPTTKGRQDAVAHTANVSKQVSDVKAVMDGYAKILKDATSGKISWDSPEVRKAEFELEEHLKKKARARQPLWQEDTTNAGSAWRN